MPHIRLQPKQCQASDLVSDSPAKVVGVFGGRGCAKSFLLDAVQLEQRILLPGTVGCIVMRNRDQVHKYHVQPMMRLWPEFEKYLNKTDLQLKIPCGDGQVSQIDFSYAENLQEVERRFRSANYYLICIDQAEQFMVNELREIRKACRWPGVMGKCKMLLSLNMGGAGIQGLRKWFHTFEYNEREDPKDYAGIHVFPWDNVEWSRPALAEDGLTAEDYYGWTDEQRMEYCAARSDYGKTLNSEDDAIRNRDWLGSWESLEGAYFGRVFDRDSMLITREQASRLLKHWDRRWISTDWGKTHYCSTHWHGRTTVSQSDAEEILGWQIQKPLKVTVTYREYITNETSSGDVAREIVQRTPIAERKALKRYALSPDAFGDKDAQETIADKIGAILNAAGMPYPEPADNDRVGGWQLMYNLMEATKRRGSSDREVWLCSADCPQAMETLPLLMRDQKNLDDVLKTDKGAARVEQDVADELRYGMKSELSPGQKPKREVLDEKLSGQTGMARLHTIMTFDKLWAAKHPPVRKVMRYQ